MGLVRHTHQCGKFLTLSAGCNHHDFVGRILIDIFYRHDMVNINHTEMFDNIHIGLHTSALYNYFLTVSSGNIHKLYYPFYLRGEGSYYHSTWYIGDYLVNVL